MYVNIVQLEVKPEYRDVFIAAYVDNGRGSLRDEPGTLDFYVVQDASALDRFILCEVYAGRAGFEAHRQGDNMRRTIGLVRDWFARPPIGLGSGNTVFPVSE